MLRKWKGIKFYCGFELRRQVALFTDRVTILENKKMLMEKEN